MKKLVFIIFCILITGCVSKVALLEKEWLGKDRNSLITTKGTPDQIMDDDFGGQIYTYIKVGSFTLPGSSTTQNTGGIWTSKQGWQYSGANTTYYPGQTLTTRRKTMFWVDSTGKIYKVSIAR